MNASHAPTTAALLDSIGADLADFDAVMVLAHNARIATGAALALADEADRAEKAGLKRRARLLARDATKQAQRALHCRTEAARLAKREAEERELCAFWDRVLP